MYLAKYIVALITPLFLFSCHQNKNSKQIDFQSDTVRINIVIDSITKKFNCSELLNYYSGFGIKIQKYYRIEDSLAIDLNSDGFIDTLVVLSPVSLEDTNYYDCIAKNDHGRLLVEIINNNGVSRVRNIYQNLISDIGGVLSKYNGIFLTKNGFEIQHQAGSRFSWEYFTEYSTKSADSISLVGIKKICSFEGFEKSIEYSFNKYSTGNINIPDTIYNNCNCDSVWLELEKKHSSEKM